jgi:hypothetical protein
MKSSTGRSGCGCLIMVLVVFLVIAALMMHPLSLRILGDRLVYKDAIVTSDAILVPYFPEDRNGELFMDAFREFWAGNGKLILVEEQRVFGLSLAELVQRLATERGIKEPVVRKVEVGADSAGNPQRLKEKVSALHLRKVIIVVPEYASRRFHAAFNDSEGPGKSLYLIRPVTVSYFAGDKWWKNATSRTIAAKEVYLMASHFLSRFTGGSKKTGDLTEQQ